MKVLVTGSHGFIGRALVERLLAEGYSLRTFDLPASTTAGREHFSGDLRDVFAVRRAVQGVEMVLHLGALSSDYRYAEEVLAVNVQGTWNVLQACMECGVRRVVYFSSINALGCVGGHRPPEYLPLDDFHPRHPMTPYQLSKHLGEEVCRSYSERYGIVTLCLRPTFVVDTTNPPWWWRRSSSGRHVEWGKDELWAYVDLQDVCDAVLRAMQVEGVLHEAFLLSASDTFVDVPTAELVQRFWSHLPWKGDREAYLMHHPYRALIDTSHAEQVLGWQPRRSWRDLLSKGGEVD
ncbi:MAG: NAD(P)-dependent oxidoreductase [bacterium]|nr:NAD(P)-dependent oxidoreductase [bacterium]